MGESAMQSMHAIYADARGPFTPLNYGCLCSAPLLYSPSLPLLPSPCSAEGSSMLPSPVLLRFSLPCDASLTTVLKTTAPSSAASTDCASWTPGSVTPSEPSNRRDFVTIPAQDVQQWMKEMQE